MLSITSKIENNAASSLIFAFSGGSTAVRASILLNERASNINPENRRKELTKIAFDSAPEGKPTGDSLIVIFYEAEPEIWTIPIGSAAVLRKDFAFGGGGNLAMYLVQRHYHSRSVEQLKFLAAHTVLEGHYFNPSVVDGLELWSSEKGGASESPEEELATFRKRSEKVHARFGKILTG
jgi:hypothetical protein